ncbi:monovalent cation/H+ antiporter subunit D family protein [Aliifodinibius salicampi]|uniref:Monovalent cation/H+ antiporter subunit D family protein n=1 Tax=Fodinibius salicampi TaxID=1920655 RepID=A0ABT3PX94_9BACT|nr:monovalent cation/H+ antiporter subunit D family protein [Fodinibius salicampi]MCW9712495.1 monovalent cation/H+ antiporter subunit D family protein [Fodinibius salicampi]
MELTFVPLYAVLASLAAVPFILLSSNKPNLREFWTILAGVVKFLLVLTLIPTALEGRTVELTLFEIAPNLPIELHADPFGVFFAIIASGLWIFTSFYSIGYMRGHKEKKQTRYFASFAVCLSSTIGIAFSGNLLTFLLFYEMLTIATYPLVIHSENKEAIRAGRKYLAYTLTAGLLLIAAVGITYSLTGTLEFQPGGIFGDVDLSNTMAVSLFLLYLGGVGVKAGIMPIHSWLPSAMAAPTPVSALLHAVAVVKSGVFGIIRVVHYVFGPEVMGNFGLNEILIVIAGFTIIVASLLAFAQDNLKRRLAYSTVGHLSYIVLGAALLTPLGLTGSIMHISAHATMKITLFFCAGAIMVNLHKKNISDLNGIAKVMPWTMGAFVIGSMGLAGIPPINGFVSKWFLGAGVLEGGMILPLIILIISGLLNVGYFFPIIHRAYFKKGGKELEGHTEASPFMVVPIVITATASVIFGLFPDLFFHFFELASNIAETVFNTL